ncbi:MAG: thioredoxin [Oscillospiraceae bacterium]|nr:thioredoxin [Oscillospiraceae bacterium]
MASVIHLTYDSFFQLAESGCPVIVDFWANWCGPCKMIAPAIEKLAAEYGDKVVIGKIDVDQEGTLAQQFGVMSIPCVVALKDGKETERLVGVRPYSAYTQLADSLLK